MNGYPKTVIHQIIRSPGIRFKNEENQILADIISIRGAWMGIQIQYEKNMTSRREFSIYSGISGKSLTFSMFGSSPASFKPLEMKATFRNFPSYLFFRRTFDTDKIHNLNVLFAFAGQKKDRKVYIKRLKRIIKKNLKKKEKPPKKKKSY